MKLLWINNAKCFYYLISMFLLHILKFSEKKIKWIHEIKTNLEFQFFQWFRASDVNETMNNVNVSFLQQYLMRIKWIKVEFNMTIFDYCFTHRSSPYIFNGFVLISYPLVCRINYNHLSGFELKFINKMRDKYFVFCTKGVAKHRSK